jgi:hypothetical protein
MDDDEYSDPDIDESDSSSEDVLPTVDERNLQNPRKLSKYAESIFVAAMNDNFSSQLSVSQFRSVQTQVTPRHREAAVLWMIQTHQNLGVVTDCLYNAVIFFDIACCTRPIAKENIQLLMMTCLWVAVKVEEGKELINHVLELSGDKFTRDDVIDCELDLIQVLSFRTNFPTTKIFLRRILDATAAQNKIAEAANFLAETSLLEIKCLDFAPATVAAAAVCLGFVGLTMPCPFNSIVQYAHIDDIADLRECANVIQNKVRDILRNPQHVLIERYSDKRLTGAILELQFNDRCHLSLFP